MVVTRVGPDRQPTCVELFAGAGGASVGLHRAGFRSLLAVEWDADAHDTLQAAGLSDETMCADVRNLELFAGLEGHVDLLWASPPCQAWSNAGKRLGASDDRNGWPWTLDVVDRIMPTWVLAENVSGMLMHGADCPVANQTQREGGDLQDMWETEFDPAQVGVPSPEECPGCYWERVAVPEFQKRFPFVAYKRLNSADYGVPQRRERVILVAGPHEIAWPDPTHSHEALWWEKVQTGEYWRRHGVAPSATPAPSEKGQSPIPFDARPLTQPWITVRDVFSQIPPEPQEYARLWVQPHQLARTLAVRRVTVPMPPDMPSDTVTIRRGGGKTNDALIWEHDGQLRYLTVAEVAAIQAFPPDYPWQGSRSARYKQVGNAVPPPLAEALGRRVVDAIMAGRE